MTPSASRRSFRLLEDRRQLRLARLRARYVVSPLSNGTLATLVALSRHGGLTWDCVIPTELVRRYKPDPSVYRRALELLDVRPDEVADSGSGTLTALG